MLDLERERIDLAIRYAADGDAPPGAIRLFGEALVPVASGALGVSAIEDRDQLRRHVLLELEDPFYAHLHWADWLRTAGAARAKPAGIVRFNQYDQVVQAALAGQGVALGRLALVEPLLHTGQLVRASHHSPRSVDCAYWLLVRGAANDRASVVQRWILDQAAHSLTDAAPARQRRASQRPQ